MDINISKHWAIRSICVVFAGLLLTVFSTVAHAQSEFGVQELQRAIDESGGQWTAAETEISKLSFEEKLQLLSGDVPMSSQDIPADFKRFDMATRPNAATREPLDPNIDWRNHNGGNWVTPVRDDGGCWAGWAFGPVAALESSILIQQNTPNIEFNLSEQDLISCSGAGSCWPGGSSTDALAYMGTTGVVDEGCFPFSANNASCSNKCANWSTRTYRHRGITMVDNWDLDQIRAALEEGPTTLSMYVYSDFFNYDGGVYRRETGIYMGGHSVELVGFDDGNHAFICKNNWGTDWGEDGFFRIAWEDPTAQPGWNVFVLERNHAPVFNSIGDHGGAIGETISFRVSAYDPEGDSVRYSMSASPAIGGAALDPDSGVFSWVPGEGASGSYSVTFTATDDWRPTLSSSTTITITVCPASCDDELPCTNDVCGVSTGGLCRHDNVADNTPCDDGLFCTVGEICSGGICGFSTARDCSYLDDQCNTGSCNDVSNQCEKDPTAFNGLGCDDQAACTTNDTCVDGVCLGESAVDCTHLDDQCNIGVCNPADGSCYKNTLPLEGHACEDGKWCTTGDTCVSGVCAPSGTRDCSAAGDQCNEAYCDETFNECATRSAPKEGLACDDGQFCTVGEECRSGACVLGQPRDCSHLTDACNLGTCDETFDQCTVDPFAKNGNLCDDAVFCTVNERCQNGQCIGGAIRSCPGDQCNAGVCNKITDSCTTDSTRMDGASCEDGLFCTEGDICQSGVCEPGEPVDCSHLDTQCISGVCDDDQDECVSDTTIKHGDSCNDGKYCTVGEVCSFGVCKNGTARDCSAFANDCNAGFCNESLQTCYSQPINEGAGCEDGLFCTIQEACVGGVCVPGNQRDCSGAVTAAECQQARCDDAINQCVADPINEGGACDDGLYCYENETCASGACVGDPVDCSSLVTSPDCQIALCSEQTFGCEVDNINEGQACDDGLFCTEATTCASGVCSGVAKDCNAELSEPQCQRAECDEDADECLEIADNEGESCDDGLFCFVGETCQSGSCLAAESRDCSMAVNDAQCQAPICTENDDNCLADPINEGQACDDDNLCTLDDSCASGRCQGVSKDCSDGVLCTLDSCNPLDGSCENTADDSACDDDNECTADTCDQTEDCLHENRPDWSFCEGEPNALDACFSGVCEPMIDNDWCSNAFPIEVGVRTKGWLDRYHSLKPVDAPCSDTALTGPDAFYTIELTGDTRYSVVLESPESIPAAVVLWTGCEAEATCILSYQDSAEAPYLAELDLTGQAGMTAVVQVVAVEEPEDGVIGQFAVAVYAGDPPADGDMDFDVEQGNENDGETDTQVDGDAETEVEEEDPLVCEPFATKCAGALSVLRCRSDGSGWTFYKDCIGDETCEDGECILAVDGDSDEAEAPVDGDVEPEADLPLDGDLDAEPEVEPEVDETPAIDGDSDEDTDNAIEPPPTGSGSGGGGCRHTGHPAALLLLLMVGVFTIRRRRQS